MSHCSFPRLLVWATLFGLLPAGLSGRRQSPSVAAAVELVQNGSLEQTDILAAVTDRSACHRYHIGTAASITAWTFTNATSMAFDSVPGAWRSTRPPGSSSSSVSRPRGLSA